MTISQRCQNSPFLCQSEQQRFRKHANKIKTTLHITLIFSVNEPAHVRLWYLSHRRPAKAQACLRIHKVWPEPSLFTHRNYGSRQRVRPKSRNLAPLYGCACVFEEFTEDKKISWVGSNVRAKTPINCYWICSEFNHVTHSSSPISSRSFRSLTQIVFKILADKIKICSNVNQVIHHPLSAE